MKNEAFERDCRDTLLVTATIVLTISLSILLAGSMISTVVLNPNSVTKLAYAVEEFDVDIDVEDNEIE
jgi:hypothetical protein